jgi:hypothetical protein
MPFLADIGPRDERRGPFWASFATLGDQLERLIVANICYTATLAPGLLALAFPELPVVLRVVLGLASATALPPATAVLYGLADVACRGQHIDVALAADLLKGYGVRSLRTLASLFGTLGVLVWAAILSSGPVQTVVTLALMLWSVCAVHWGPMFVAEPGMTGLQLARACALMAWRRPEQAFVGWLLGGLSLVVGAVSIGGLVLIVPVLLAVQQTHRYRSLAC